MLYHRSNFIIEEYQLLYFWKYIGTININVIDLFITCKQKSRSFSAKSDTQLPAGLNCVINWIIKNYCVDILLWIMHRNQVWIFVSTMI